MHGMKGVVRAASLAAIACVVAVLLLGAPSAGVGQDPEAAHAMTGDTASSPVVRGVGQAPLMADPTPIVASADTYVRSGAPNTNEGASTFMRLQASGDNRGLVRFDQSDIQSAVGSG